jgi:hypothetical protein
MGTTVLVREARTTAHAVNDPSPVKSEDSLRP